MPDTSQPSFDSPSPAKGGEGETLADQVVAYLRDYIASHGLKPGSRLPSETTISTTLGISRPIVREAMRTLAATGLIEMAVGKRAAVTGLGGGILRNIIENAVLIGQANIRHVMEMRRGIEIAMVALAAERCTEADAERLRRIVAEMAERINDADVYTSLDISFHLALAETTRNPLYLMLVEACRQVFQKTMVIGIERWAETPELDRVQQLHEAIVAAVAARDPQAATQAMTQHFDNAIRVIFGDTPPSGLSAAAAAAAPSTFEIYGL